MILQQSVMLLCNLEAYGEGWGCKKHCQEREYLV